MLYLNIIISHQYLIIEILLVAVLAYLAYQDYRFRAISWFLIPTLLVAFAAYNSAISWPAYFNHLIINITFIFLQLLLVTLYFSVKQKKAVNISKGLIGIGDILFLICLCFFFSPLNYIVFYVSSLIIVILVTILFNIMPKGYQNRTAGMQPKIPLAGIQAIWLIFILLVNRIFLSSGLNSDSWLTALMD